MEDKQQRILDYVAQHGEQIIEDLKQLVQVESPATGRTWWTPAARRSASSSKSGWGSTGDLPAGTAGRPHDVHPGAGRRADLDLGPL